MEYTLSEIQRYYFPVLTPKEVDTIGEYFAKGYNTLYLEEEILKDWNKRLASHE